jgi:hypothetical protein
MKELRVLLTVYILMIVLLFACTKVDLPTPQGIDLGRESTSTSIKNVSKVDNIITVDYQVTVGSKYSVQIIPFGSEEAVLKQGFTADAIIVTRSYDLSSLKKMDYDLVLTDIKGTEIKYPITKN